MVSGLEAAVLNQASVGTVMTWGDVISCIVMTLIVVMLFVLAERVDKEKLLAGSKLKVITRLLRR